MRTHSDADRRIYRQLLDDIKLMIRNYENENFTRFTLNIDEKHVTNIQEFSTKIKQIKGHKKHIQSPIWQQGQLIHDVHDKLEIFRQHYDNIHREPQRTRL